MARHAILTAMFILSLGGGAMAACPTVVPGSTSEAIRANAQRVLCLQEEVDDSARQRQFELELRANQNAIQSLQMQRRFDILPRAVIPAPFSQPQPFVPN